MTSAYIIGVGMTPLGKLLDRSVKDLTREAVSAALRDADVDVGDIQAAWFCNTRQAMLEGQNTVRGQCALRPLGFGGMPIVNVENACASGSTGVREAAAHVKAGLCDIALVVGAEKMVFPDRPEAMLRAFRGGTDIYEIDALRRRLEALPGESVPEDKRRKEREHSLFMDIYAAIARMHMYLYGTTQRQMAATAAKNHRHSTLNPLSQYRHDMTVDEVLADPLINWPLTRAMCAPVSDGAAAAVVCSETVLRRLGRSRAVRIDAAILRSGSDRDPADLSRQIGRLAALDAYEASGLAPSDIDVAEVHDACSFAEILQVENLGLCARGEGGPAGERGETALGGRVPVNPSGGLVSKGHPVGATGVLQLVELVTQLRGEANSRQVVGARVAAAENGGGFWGIEEAATSVILLSRA